MERFSHFMLLGALTATLAGAQNISGDWQGTVKAGAQELRLILQVAKSGNGTWSATMLIVDQSPDRGAGLPSTSFSLEDSKIGFAIGGGTYDGKLSADGASIRGTWTRGRSMPLEFRRATKETVWLDPSPHNAQFITVDKNVNLEGSIGMVLEGPWFYWQVLDTQLIYSTSLRPD